MGLRNFMGCNVHIKSKWQFRWGVFNRTFHCFIVVVLVLSDVREGGSSHNLINVLAVHCLLRSPQRISAISFPFPLSNNLQYISYELLCLECKRYIQKKGREKDLEIEICKETSDNEAQT